LAGRLSRKIDGRRKLEGDWKAWLEIRQAATVAGRDESGTGPLNLSILLSGGKETNRDAPSNGE